jgi:hypothetical protein
MKHILIFLTIALLFFSCKKEKSVQHSNNNTDISTELIDHTVLSSTRDDDKEESAIGVVDSIFSHVSNSNGSGIQTAVPITFGGACVPGTWYIKQSYIDNYIHFYQMNAKPDYPGGVLCGPTSYLMAAHMIASAKNHAYPSSKPKLGAIYNALYNAGKFDNTEGMYISDVLWFNNTYDNPVIQASYLRTSNRISMKEYIEGYLKAGYPVIATVNIYGMHGSSWTNDGDGVDQASTQYYVSKNGPVGHFILLIGIKINADGSGTIWYKDPLSSTGATRSASYSRILDAMKYNGNNTYYDAVGVAE